MRTGIDARTGAVLSGWDHCAQAIGFCLTTRFASLVMQRHLASAVKELQDENADPATIFGLYRGIAEALNDEDGGEPGYSLRAIELVEHGRRGRFVFLMSGVYFPRGHLGDYSLREERALRWPEAA